MVADLEDVDGPKQGPRCEQLLHGRLRIPCEQRAEAPELE